jgi:hypothetical protein
VISIVILTEVLSVTRGRLGARALAEIDQQVVDYSFEVASVGSSDLAHLRQALLDFDKGRRRPPAVLKLVISLHMPLPNDSGCRCSARAMASRGPACSRCRSERWGSIDLRPELR